MATNGTTINGALIEQTRKARQSWERPHLNLGRAELARRVGCDAKTIWAAEHGRNVQWDTLVKIADALDLSLDALRVPPPRLPDEAVA